MHEPFRRSDSGALATITIVLLATVAGLSAVWLTSARAQSQPGQQTQKVVLMSGRAIGDFTVKVTPDGDVDKAQGAALGRMTLDKQFTGDLTGTSKGQMLTAMTDVKGSAGYVAIERVTGTLQGHNGSFVLQHFATMSAASGPQQSITVVPDSGTGQLVGIAGQMLIKIAADGKHSYEFAYKLPAAQ
jgi:uncharacterized protein DUF3224